MTLTPIDVQQKTFVTTFRGYDLDEVDDFLDDVVTTLKDYEQRLHDAQQRISALEAQADGRGESEAAISRALVAAQRSADMIVTEAKAEASEIMAGATVDARALEEKRSDEQRRLETELDSMRTLISDLKGKIAALAAPMAEDAETMAAAVDATGSALSEIRELAPSPMAAPDEPAVAEDAVAAAPDQGEDEDDTVEPYEPGETDEFSLDLDEPDVEVTGEADAQDGDQADAYADVEDDPTSLGFRSLTGWEIDRENPLESGFREKDGERVPRPWEDD